MGAGAKRCERSRQDLRRVRQTRPLFDSCLTSSDTMSGVHVILRAGRLPAIFLFRLVEQPRTLLAVNQERGVGNVPSGLRLRGFMRKCVIDNGGAL